jgi:hypothetical protein
MAGLLGAAMLAGGMVVAPGAAALAAAGLATPPPSDGSANTSIGLVNVSVPGKVSGSQTCFTATPRCITMPGIANLTVTASAVLDGTALPVITLTSAPGCSGPISVGAIVTPGQASGVVTITIQYDLADLQGNAIPNTHTMIIKSLPFSAGTPPITVTECASAD